MTAWIPAGHTTRNSATKPRRHTLFARHRRDLIDAMDRVQVAQAQVIQVLVDEVEFLRYMLLNRPHMHPLNAAAAPLAGEPSDRPMWLSEEEEELLNLRLQDHISQTDLDALQSELGIELDTEYLEPSE